jgi:DNA-binding HxlR family transcriptional regulator
VANEHLKEFTFDGIRRKTGMHQEMLSRTLERLRQGSLIVKTSKGYSVSHKPGLTYIESLNEGEKNGVYSVGSASAPE